MYAVWERDTVESLEHEDAIAAIELVEEVLEKPKYEYNKKLTQEANRLKEFKHTSDRVRDIQQILIDYVTGFGSAGRVYKYLIAMRELIKNKALMPKKPLEGEDLEFIENRSKEVMDLIHDHNRTFWPDPSKHTIIRHHDFPDCPDKALLPEEKRKRVEMSRKCSFNLKRIPIEVKNLGEEGEEEKFFRKAIARINEMLGVFEAGADMVRLVEADAEKRRGRPGGSDGTKRGNNATNHDALRSRAPISNNGTDRDFVSEDPDFDRGIVIYDSTLT
jgi:hypothetical protein